MKKSVLTLLLVLLSVACSQHWRTASTGVSWDQMNTNLQNFIGNSDTTSLDATGDSTDFTTMANDSGAVIYYAEAPAGGLGPVPAVASINDFTPFTPSSDQVPTFSSISDIQIFFIDDPSSSLGYHANGLLVAIQASGASNYTVSSFTSDGSPSSGKSGFTATLTDGNGNTLVLFTDDVDSSGNLQSVIQLSVTWIDPNGNQNQIGKFSTLVGYAQ